MTSAEGDQDVPIAPVAYTLSVHPSVIFKLGQDLITDDIQALTELLKNAYDADSPTATVVIDTDVWTDLKTGALVDDVEARRQVAARDRVLHELAELERDDLAIFDREDQGAVKASKERARTRASLSSKLESLPEPLQGRISVADRGTGMTVDQIVAGWLVVSASAKRNMKARGEKTGRLRTPLGDKGLGRLGAQRLGRVMDLTTTPRLDRERDEREEIDRATYRVSIDWDRFLQVDALSAVPISVLESSDPNSVFGSRIEIRGLTNRDFWLASRNDELELLLATMVSPYGGDRGFKVTLVINGDSNDLGERSAHVLDHSMVTYQLEYADSRLEVAGSASIEYFRNPQSRADSAIWEDLLVPDNGGEFLRWVLESDPGRSSEIRLEAGDDRHFARFGGTISLSSPGTFDVRKARVTQEVERDASGYPIDFGRFSGRVDQVPLRTNSLSVFDSAKEYREFVRVLSGIRVYRDGFGVRLARDWLDLAEQWSGAGSWYTLRPENVIGHIDLTAEFNSALEETSAREDFKDVPAYRNFMKLLGEWLAFTEYAQEFLRRKYLEYRKMRVAAVGGVDVRSSPDQLTERVEAQLAGIEQIGHAVAAATSAAGDARVAIDDLKAQRQELTNSLLFDERALRIYDDAVDAATRSLARVDSAAALASSEAAKVTDSRAALELLVTQLHEAQEQIKGVWELVSLGLTAESVAHEVGNVTDRLKTRSSQVERYVKSSSNDERVLAYIEAVRSSATTLAQQVRHLDSSLRYARDRREVLRLTEVLNESVEYFRSRWNRRQLRIEVEVRKEVEARFSRGKLAQVFDNLFLNSQYWLEQEAREGGNHPGTVSIVVDSPYLFFSDSGPGIDPSVEFSLFDPFVTRKPAGRGRGLGLFVVQQLLDSEGARISLDSIRNDQGRLFLFRIDFTNQL